MFEFLNKLAANEEETGLTKSAQYLIVKKAQDKTIEYLKESKEFENAFPEVIKIANDELEKMSEEDKVKAHNLYAFGAGCAYGEALTKEAMAGPMADEIYATMIQVLNDKGHEKLAEEVDKVLNEESPALTEAEIIAEVASEAAAENLVEEAGGEEVVEKNPEIAAEILETSQAIGAEVAQEVTEKTGE